MNASAPLSPSPLDPRTFLVFAITPETKKPAVLWSNPETWRRGPVPEGMWHAVLTGEPNGVFVLDLDVKKDRNGIASIAEAFPSGLPDTYTVQTKSGGFHLYFRRPADGLRNRIAMRPGCDVKADRGYVVGPGTPGYSVFADLPIADAPPELLAMIRREGEAVAGESAIAIDASHVDWEYRLARATAFLASEPPCISGQGGDAQLLKVALRLARTFECPHETSLELLEPYNARCTPPWTREEILHKLTFAAERGTGPTGCAPAGFAQGWGTPAAANDGPPGVLQRLHAMNGEDVPALLIAPPAPTGPRDEVNFPFQTPPPAPCMPEDRVRSILPHLPRQPAAEALDPAHPVYGEVLAEFRAYAATVAKTAMPSFGDYASLIRQDAIDAGVALGVSTEDILAAVPNATEEDVDALRASPFSEAVYPARLADWNRRKALADRLAAETEEKKRVAATATAVDLREADLVVIDRDPILAPTSSGSRMGGGTSWAVLNGFQDFPERSYWRTGGLPLPGSCSPALGFKVTAEGVVFLRPSERASAVHLPAGVYDQLFLAKCAEVRASWTPRTPADFASADARSIDGLHAIKMMREYAKKYAFAIRAAHDLFGERALYALPVGLGGRVSLSDSILILSEASGQSHAAVKKHVLRALNEPGPLGWGELWKAPSGSESKELRRLADPSLFGRVVAEVVAAKDWIVSGDVWAALKREKVISTATPSADIRGKVTDALVKDHGFEAAERKLPSGHRERGFRRQHPPIPALEGVTFEETAAE